MVSKQGTRRRRSRRGRFPRGQFVTPVDEADEVAVRGQFRPPRRRFGAGWPCARGPSSPIAALGIWGYDVLGTRSGRREGRNMVQHAAAVFEKGCLVPVRPLEGIPDHAFVRITVESIGSPSREEQLAMLRDVPIAAEQANTIEAGRNRKWTPEEFQRTRACLSSTWASVRPHARTRQGQPSARPERPRPFGAPGMNIVVSRADMADMNETEGA